MKHVFTTGQVARICGVSQQAVIKWFNSGLLEGYRVPESRDRRIPRESLLRFMDRHGIPRASLEPFDDERDHHEEGNGPAVELQGLRRRNRELTALLDITNQLFEPFALDDLLGRIMSLCRHLLDAEAASVLLVEEETRKLHFYWVEGGTESEIKEIILEPGQGIAGWCAETGQSVLVEDAQHDARFFPEADKKSGFVTRSVICVPILGQVDEADEADGDGGPEGGESAPPARKRIIGVVEVLNKRGGGSFRRHDLELLGVVASQVGRAISKVRQQDRVREQDRLATIGSMAGAIIHDLKNPMTIIKGFTYLLKKRSNENTRYCDYITQEIDRLVDMSKELLDFCRGELHYVFIQVSMGEFMDDFARFVEHDLEDRRIELDVDLDYRGQVELDPEKIRRVLLNLVTNAREAMGTGGRLTLRTVQDGDWVCIRVADSGCGMAAEVRKKLFRPFFTHGKERGTGLGLAIVKNIVEAHGGVIEVESQVGEGSTFQVRLPIQGATVGRPLGAATVAVDA